MGSGGMGAGGMVACVYSASWLPSLFRSNELKEKGSSAPRGRAWSLGSKNTVLMLVYMGVGAVFS